MTEHQIRLRAAWKVEFEGRSGRVDLPTDWTSTRPAGPFRLLRSFRLPVLAPGEALSIELESIPGATAVRLDSRLLAEIRPGAAIAAIAPADFPAGRVTLSIDVDPTGWDEGRPGGGSPWGHISLRIRG